MANQSWKTYGGINRMEKMNYITTKSVISNNISTKEAYIGNYDICGSLHVSNDTYVTNNLYINGNTDISGSFSIHGNALLNNNAQISGNASIKKNLDVSGNTNINGIMNVFNKLYIGSGNPNANLSPMYLYGKNPTDNINSNNSGIGLNTVTPQATFDIVGTNPSSLNVSTTAPINTNILAKNISSHGIVLSTNDVSSCIQFYNDKIINKINNGDAQIKYMTGGKLLIDVSNSTNIRSKLTVSNHLDETNTNIFNETVTIFDISSGPYLGNNYYIQSENLNEYNSGNALTLVSDNSNSNTFLNITTPNKIGMSIGGGSLPNDIMRSIGIISLFDNCGNSNPVQTIVSGNIDVLQRATIGINKYSPITEKYVLDINGPIHIDNGDITNVYKVSYTIKDIAKSPLNQIQTLCVSVGKNVISYSNNGGKIWNNFNLLKIDNTDIVLNSIFVYDSSNAITGGNNGFTFKTTDAGQTWSRLFIGRASNINSIYTYTSALQVYYIIAYNNNFIPVSPDSLNNSVYTIPYNVNNSGNRDDYFNLMNINNICGYSDIYIGFAGYTNDNRGCIIIKDLSNNRYYSYINNNTSEYNKIKSTFISPNYITVAVGNGIISSSVVTDYTTICSNTNFINRFVSGVIFNDIYIYDTKSAVAVGNSAAFYYTNDGYNTWNSVPINLLNSSGISNIICNLTNNFIGVYMNDINSFVITSIDIDGSSNIYYCYLPNIFNSKNNKVLDICGNMQITGDVIVDNNVYIKESIKVDYDSSLNGNLFVGYDSSLNGNVFIKKHLTVVIDSSLNGNLVVGHNTLLNGNLLVMCDSSMNANLVVGGNTNVQGNLLVIRDVSMNSNLVVGGNTNVQGNLNVNANLFVLKDVSMNSNLVVGGNTNVCGNLLVIRDVSMNSNLVVGGNTTVQSNLIVNANFIVSKDVSMNSNLVVGGNTIVSGNLLVIHDVSMNSNLVVGGNTTIQGNLNVNANLFVSKDVSMNSNLVVGGNTIVQGNLLVVCDVSMNSNLVVGGNTTVKGNLLIDCDVSMNANLIVGGIIKTKNGIYTDTISNYSDSITIKNSGNTSIQGSLINITGSSQNSVINIGKTNDIVNLIGNIVYIGTTTYSTSSIQLNDNVSSSSSSAGIYIGDNYNNNASYMIMSNDRNGVLLKAAASQNVIKIDTSNLQNTNYGNSIVTLHPSSELDSSFTMVSSNIDISNILLRNGIVSTLTKQVISTDLEILGNLIINKNNINPNVIMDISGNAIITRLGLNTTAIDNNAILAVTGNIIHYSGFIQQF